MGLPFTKIMEISLGPVTIQTWGLMIALGMLLGLWISIKEAKRRKIKPEAIMDLFLWIVVSSMIGGRLLYVILFWETFAAEPLRIFKLWEGGMVFYGGIVAAVLAMWAVVRHKKLSFLKVMDTVAPGFAIGIFVGRIGCYLIGDHIGSLMQHQYFWGSVFPGETRFRHEPSLYLSINGLLLFLFLWAMRRRVKKPGQLSMLFFIWYGLSRFILDYFRADDLVGFSDPRFGGLTISQIISALLFLFGLAALCYPGLLQWKKKK